MRLAIRHIKKQIHNFTDVTPSSVKLQFMTEFGAFSYLNPPFTNHFFVSKYAPTSWDITTTWGQLKNNTHYRRCKYSPASLYPNAICLDTTVHTIPTLTTVTSPSYHKNIDWATVTCAAMGICAVLWYYTGQATVSLAGCMSSWAGCCPGAWPLLPVAGSCHLLLVPVCCHIWSHVPVASSNCGVPAPR